MKRFFAGFCALFLLLLLTPALALTNGQPPLTGQQGESDGSYYLVKNARTGEVMKLSPLDYIKGVVAAEMPLSYHTEALKAQAVAAHSYALYRINQKLNSSSGSGEAYLSTDPAECQGYLDLEGRKTQWGDQFDAYEAKLTEAVSAVIDKILVSDGEPVMAMFHAVSGGRTEDAANLFGSSVSYLVPADSAGDELSPSFLAEKTFTTAQMKEALLPLLNGAALSDSPADWFGAPERSDSGTVLSVAVGGVSVKGTALRDALSLASANFTVTLSDDTFTVITRGRGHGVGMSQYGADFLARQGETYEQILLHYYTGVTIRGI